MAGPRLNPRLISNLLKALPPSASAVVYAFAGVAFGWTLHAASGPLQNRMKGKSNAGDVQVLDSAKNVDTRVTRILGQPSSPTAIFRRIGDNFVAEVDPSTKNPRWVAELLTPETVSGPAVHREGLSFHEETAVPSHMRARLKQYAGSGYDRGHMAAAANHRGSDEALSETFWLSNICPQVGVGMNRDYWARLEAFTRHLLAPAAQGEGDAAWEEVRVLTGPLYLPEHAPGKGQGTEWRYSHPALEQAGQWLPVPSHFFKVILASKRGQEAVAAFVMPNAPIPADKPLTDFLVPLTTLEALSGLQVYRDALGGEAGIRQADGGLGAVLGLSADPASASVSLGIHTSRALNVHSLGSSSTGIVRGPGHVWPPVLLSGLEVESHKGVKRGEQGGEKQVWHLCALQPCVLPAAKWFVHRDGQVQGSSNASTGGGGQARRKKGATDSSSDADGWDMLFEPASGVKNVKK